MTLRSAQRGYLMVTVIVTLFLVATIAVLLTHESSMSANTANRQLESARADYVARAGLQHALWRAQNNACMGDVTIPDTAIGSDSYNATITGAASGSLVTVFADQDAWIRSDDVSRNNGTSAANHIRMESPNVEQVLTRFNVSSIPTNAQISSAVAWFHLEAAKEHPGESITIHEITADWAETAVTWESFAGAYRPGVIGVVPAQDTGDVWVAVNLTAQVQAWVNGYPNYGILFASTDEGIHTQYTAREDGTNPPRLEVVVGSGQASPVTMKAKGKLDTGVVRNAKDKMALAYQPPTGTMLQPDPARIDDAWITAGQTAWNYGAHASLRVQPGNQQSFIRFDLDGAVPRGALVSRAALELYAYDVPSSGAIDLHRVTRAWAEGSCFGNCAADDGVTWDTYDGTNTWDTPGGDIEAIAAATVTPSGANSWVSWDITDLAVDWVSGAIDNHGVQILGNPGYALFHSSDALDPVLRPRLTIEYACECGTACLAPNGTGRIALIGDDPTPNPDDQLKIGIIESWGYDVDFYEDLDSDTINWSNYDLAYVSETTVSGDVSANLAELSIGIVNEEPNLYNDLLLAGGDTEHVGSSIDIIDNSHFITAVFPPGSLPIYTGDMEILTANTPLASGLQKLAEFNGAATLTALDKGAQATSGTAAGRRVTLPLGQHFAAGFDWANLNQNGYLLVQRAIAWSMSDDIASVGKLLLVVGNDGSLTDQESAKKSLLESWGYTVNVIDEDDSQGTFDTALAANDVVFVTEDATASDIGSKLTDATIGVVIEEVNLADDLGLAGAIDWDSGTTLNIVDASHYITSPFPAGTLTVMSTSESLAFANVSFASDVKTLAVNNQGASIISLEAGGSTHATGSAAGRRVMLPWGGNNMDVAYLNDDGLTLMRRSLEWAAGAESDNGPLAHWKLDEGAGTTAVDSEGGHDGTLLNGPTWTAGAVGGGLAFDGSNDIVTVPHNDALSLTTYTISAWFYATDTSGYQCIVNKGVLNAMQWALCTVGTELVVGGEDGGGAANRAIVTSGAGLQVNRWYHAAGTFDEATGDIKVYLDGTLIDSGNIPWIPASNTDIVRIGQTSGSSDDWRGVLDEIRLYDRVLSDAEIAELADRPPIAHWKLDETSGTTAVDSVGGHDGTLVNGPAWTTGRLDGGLMFDGSNDYVVIPHDDSLSFAQSITFSAWVYSTNLNMFDLVLGKGNNATTYAYYFGTEDDEIVFGFKDASFHSFATPDLNLSTDTWHHIAATYNNSEDRIVLYHNGVEVHSASTTLDLPVNTNDLYIGTSENGAYWNGTLDDVRIYDRALAAYEIAELAGSLGPIAHWKLDDGTGATAIDSEGGHDGTLANGPTWVAGQLGDALGFTGGTEYVDLTSDPELDDIFVGGATVMAWINPDDWGDNGYGRILDKSTSPSSTGDGWAIRLNKDNDGLNFGQGFSGGRGWWRLPTGSIQLDTWQHVAIAYSADSTTNDPAIYLNGGPVSVIRVDTPSGSIRSDAAINLRLGNHAGGTSHTFKGVIDDVRVYDSMLGTAEIAAIVAEAGGGGGGGGGGDCYADDFESGGYSGSTGTLDWTTSWVEFGDDNSSSSGDERVQSESGDLALRVRDNDGGGEGVYRDVDLSGFTAATLTLEFRRHNLDTESDWVAVQVSNDGGATWHLLGEFHGPGSDDNYQTYSHAIGAPLTATTRIRLITSPTLGGTDAVYFDNVEICDQ